MSVDDERRRALEAVRRHGRDVVAFQVLEAGRGYWFDAPAPDGTGACVGYADTGGAWVAAGAPLAPRDQLARAAGRFVAAARAAGRRACFFAVERPEELGEVAALRLGEQPTFDPAAWPATIARRRRLREQLRRARAKGVTVRRAGPAELAEGTPLRARGDAIAREWLAERHMEPMEFLVSLEPFVFPGEHRYHLAERGGQAIALASLVPVPGRRGWLVEDLVRAADAPNGTSELLLDAAIRDVGAARAEGGDEAAFVSLGLAPLSGEVAWWLRLARFAGAPLYDFAALRAFKQRLHPAWWEPVFLAYPRRRPGALASLLALGDSLRAFAGGSLLGFGVRSILRHPSGLPWLLALPLVPWTALLAVLAVFHGGGPLGFHPLALAGWVGFDALLAVLLFRAARRPRRRRLAALAGIAALDATLSVAHLARVGLGASAAAVALRLAATVAPIGGTLALAWAATRARPPRRQSSGFVVR